jgi:hypothetical protein|tara:strand:- start:240 stop:404 length:165 start_codon:yes stop_codon:yes gene_type:complete
MEAVDIKARTRLGIVLHPLVAVAEQVLAAVLPLRETEALVEVRQRLVGLLLVVQ